MIRPNHLALVLPLAVSLAACSGGNPNPDTPATDSTASFQPTVPAGTPIYVNRLGQWVPASVVRQTGPTNVLIHYEGMPAEWDEDVPFDRVRSRPVAAAPAADFKVGEAVLVNVQNRTVLAEVTQANGAAFRVHFSGWGPEAVQDVTAAQIQRPFAGATAFGPGSPVLADLGGPTPYPAKVLAVVAADKWLVRIDNAGPQYDQVVDALHLRPFEAPPAVTPPPAVTGAPTAAPHGSGAPDAGKPPAGKTPPAAATPAAPAPLKAGDAVLVLVRGVYYPGKIVSAGAAAGSFKVRVEGAAADEEASEKNVARLQDPQKNKYGAGQLVFVEWHGLFMAAKVMKDQGSGNYSVRLEGKGAESDEIIPARRLRPR